jgi:hypothetical protein
MPAARRAVPSVVALVALLSLAPGAPARMKIRVAKPTETVRIPQSTAVGTYFEESQRISTKCRANERALAPGILDAPRHVVAQSFGPSAVGAFATGIKGRVRLKLQLLCARGSGIVHRRKPGRTRPGGTLGGSPALVSSARIGCGKRRYAIGAPLSQEFSPGFGRFVSKPAGLHGWQATVEGIPSTFPLQSVDPVYADVACVPKSSLARVQTIDGSTQALHRQRTAKLRLTCKGGRRPVGWGVDLRPFTRSPHSAANDGWLLPIVRKAAFKRRSVVFQFDLPPGAATGAGNGLSAADVAQTGYAVCAKLR